MKICKWPLHFKQTNVIWSHDVELLCAILWILSSTLLRNLWLSRRQLCVAAAKNVLRAGGNTTHRWICLMKLLGHYLRESTFLYLDTKPESDFPLWRTRKEMLRTQSDCQHNDFRWNQKCDSESKLVGFTCIDLERLTFSRSSLQ